MGAILALIVVMIMVSGLAAWSLRDGEDDDFSGAWPMLAFCLLIGGLLIVAAGTGID